MSYAVRIWCCGGLWENWKYELQLTHRGNCFIIIIYEKQKNYEGGRIEILFLLLSGIIQFYPHCYSRTWNVDQCLAVNVFVKAYLNVKLLLSFCCVLVECCGIMGLGFVLNSFLALIGHISFLEDKVFVFKCFIVHIK